MLNCIVVQEATLPGREFCFDVNVNYDEDARLDNEFEYEVIINGKTRVRSLLTISDDHQKMWDTWGTLSYDDQPIILPTPPPGQHIIQIQTTINGKNGNIES